MALRLASSSRGLGHLPNKQKNAPGIYRCTACQFVKYHLENDFGKPVFKLGKRYKFAKCKEGRIEVMENLGKGQVSERNVMEDVGIMLNRDYCTGEEKFTFFRLPKCLVDDVCFAELSGDAKLLYAFFLDRVSLSIKNGWIDDKGRVFIYYSVKSVCEDLNCGTQKACKLLDELEKMGALERKRQGLGKPNKLYLKKVF